MTHHRASPCIRGFPFNIVNTIHHTYQMTPHGFKPGFLFSGLCYCIGLICSTFHHTILKTVTNKTIHFTKLTLVTEENSFIRCVNSLHLQLYSKIYSCYLSLPVWCYWWRQWSQRKAPVLHDVQGSSPEPEKDRGKKEARVELLLNCISYFETALQWILYTAGVEYKLPS